MQKPLFTDVMVDLETLARSPDSVIISIGIVPFNLHTGEYTKEDSLHLRPDPVEQVRSGRVIDYSTVKWWTQQDQAAREYFNKDSSTILPVGLKIIKNYFNKFIIPKLNNEKNVRVWGNGPTFDISILEHAFRQHNISIPWGYGDVRCVRTITDFNPKVKEKYKSNFSGTMHDPVDDCISQIGYISEIVREIYEKSARG